MADADRGSPAGLTARLAAEGYRYEFFQAVALLEHLAARQADEKYRHQSGAYTEGVAGRTTENPFRPDRLGEGADPAREAMSLASPAALRFAPSDIVGISGLEGEGRVRVETRVLGLAGGGGPLPDWVTELMALRAPRGDRAMRDFLDLFNHRLLSLLYRVRDKARVGFGYRPPETTPAARYLLSLIGMGTGGLAERMAVPDRLLLSYAGLLAGTTRSVGALERLLSHALAVPVKVSPLTGRWLHLPEQELTRLGRGGAHNRLGGGAMLGGRVWDVESCFTLVVGPLGWAQVQDFLPGAARHAPLAGLTRFFVGDAQDFVIRLQARRAEIPPLRLSARTGARLGWTSILKARTETTSDGVIRFRPRLQTGKGQP
jgi:type VI secretion system protein ImpH